MDRYTRIVAIQHIEVFLLEEQEATAAQIWRYLSGLDLTLLEVEEILKGHKRFVSREVDGVELWSDAV